VHYFRTADLYIDKLIELTDLPEDYLKSRIIRVFPPKERIAPHSIRAFTPTNNKGYPQFNLVLADLLKFRVIVSTLSGTHKILRLNHNNQGFKFSHIIIDEAAQALEVETLMPLCLAGPRTKVIVTGDHQQIKPQVPNFLM